MKKIFSLIIALTLLVSVFGISAVAFADGEARTVTVNNAALMTLVGTDTFLEDSASFKGWLTTTQNVKDVFVGINFAMFGDEGYDKNAKYDTVRLEYCTGDIRYEDNWVDDEKTLVVAAGGTNFNLKLSGWVAFRYSATYKPSADAEEVPVKTNTFLFYVVDTTAPTLEVGTTLADKASDGLTVGKAYTISTSSSNVKVTDSSSCTTTFVIQKLINGQYVEVYSSVDGLSESYEGKDIASGTITPTADDVLDKATYKIVFKATDAYGYASEELVVELKVNANTENVEEEKKVDVLKIVLYIVAGLSAVGIVVLLCIKPKKDENTRIVYTETPTDSDNK